MDTITSKQKRQLKSQAHKLHPVVIIGNNGLTATVLAEIDRALTDHELIKVRINIADREQKQQLTKTICEQASAQLVQTIGHIIVIYRKPAD